MMSELGKNIPKHLFAGRSSDLEDKKERRLYRFFEVFPGLLIWITFTAVITLSYFKPVWVGIFILAFAFFWLLKSVYLSLHLRSSYKRMQEHEKMNWLEKVKNIPKEEYTAQVKDRSDVWHLVVIPMYQEPYEILKATMQALKDTDWPKEKMIIALGTEERAGEEARKTAEIIKNEFSDDFGRFIITVHPGDIEGEVAGKGSNETWAAKKAKKEIIDAENIPYEHILVSALDSDTVVYPQYFSCLTYYFLTTEDPYRTSYQPIPLFINNIWQAPAISRVTSFSSTFWHIMSQEMPEKQTTFSSHAMTFNALVDVGFWQTNVVSEDSRIFFQCFLRYSGDYKAVGLYYPIAMDANVAKSTFKTFINVYKQQRRWGYGSENIPYLMLGYYKDRSIPFGRFFRHAFNKIEGFYSWATYALLLFVLGWLPVWLGGDEFNTHLFSYNLLHMVRLLLTLAMIGLVSSAYLSMLILPPRPPKYGKYKYAVMVLQWFLVFITLIFLGAFPAIDAQTRLMVKRYMGFWVTPKHREE